MPTQIAAGETDDPRFVALLNLMVRGLVSRSKPYELWIVQIDNWFDHKWLRFGMKQTNAAPDGFDQGKVTFPPFTPNRIVSQWSFLRVDDNYLEAPLTAMPHRSEKRPSGANLHRRAHDFGRSACFVWYSSNTLANGRGSIMVYNIVVDQLDCWFAAFKQQGGWKLSATKGATRQDLEQLLSTPSNP